MHLKKKAVLNKEIADIYENILHKKNQAASREDIVASCYQLYKSYISLKTTNYKPSRASRKHLLETAVIESGIALKNPSEDLLESITNAGLYLSEIDKVVEILTAYMNNSQDHFPKNTENLINRILEVIDNYNPPKSVPFAYSNILIHYSSEKQRDKASEFLKLFTNYISLDNSADAKAYYNLSLGYYKFMQNNIFEAIHYLTKITSNEMIRRNKKLFYKANHILSIAYAYNSMMDLALRYLDVCLSDDSPLNKINLRFMKSRMLSQLKCYSACITILEEIKTLTQNKTILQKVTEENFMVSVMNEKTDQAQFYFVQLEASQIANIPLLFLYSYYLSIGNFEEINLTKIETEMNTQIDKKEEYYQEYLFFLLEYYAKLNDGEKVAYYLSKYRVISSEISLNQKEIEMKYYHNLLVSYEKISQEEAIKKELSTDSISQTLEKTIIGNSPEMTRVKQECLNVSNATFSNVLLTGETGTGKELFAKYIHYNSYRSSQNFCEFNLTAITPTLIESELFGYKKGAFTGADQDKLGILNIVDKGTLFLDEISEISLDIQTKLLKVLEDKEFYPLGSTSPVKSDFRIISATNKDLLKLTKENKFRIDLFYRLCNYEINLPPLRARSGDITSLAKYYLVRYCKKLNIAIPKINQNFESNLKSYKFPGNVRELRNMMQRIAISLANNENINVVLENYLNLQKETIPTTTEILSLEMVTSNAIKEALLETNGVQLQAAKLLGITANSIARKILKYNLFAYCK